MLALMAACLCAAEQDSVRLLTVESCGPLARLLSKDDAVRSILPIVQTFSQVLHCLQLHACIAPSYCEYLQSMCCCEPASIFSAAVTLPVRQWLCRLVSIYLHACPAFICCILRRYTLRVKAHLSALEWHECAA